MGFSVSATMAIFFATFLLFFALLYEAVDSSFSTISEGLNQKYNDAFDKTQITFQLIDVEYDDEANVLSIHIKNTGSISLDKRETNALIGGMLIDSGNLSTRVLGTSITNYWHPNDVLEINLSAPDIAFSASVADRRLFSTDNSLSTAGNLSVADQIFVVDVASIDVFDLDGTYKKAIIDATNLISPSDVKTQGDYLYVLDQYSHIDRFTKAGIWVDKIVNDSANTSNPRAFDVDSNYIYIIDNNDHIDRYSLAGAFVDALIANGGTMSSPQDICASDKIYVIDYSTGSYHVDSYALDGTGGVQLIEGAQLTNPRDISASDKYLADKFVYIVNDTREIAVFNSTGSPVEKISAGLSNSVRGVDFAGRIFVTDEANGLICEHLGTSVKLVFDRGTSMMIEL